MLLPRPRRGESMGGPPGHRGDPPGLRQPAQTHRRYPCRTDATPCHDQPGSLTSHCSVEAARFPSQAASRPRRLVCVLPKSRQPSVGAGRGAATSAVWCGRAHPRVGGSPPRAATSRVCVRIALPPSPSSEGVPPDSGFAGKWDPSNYRNSLPLLPHSGEREAAGRSLRSPRNSLLGSRGV
jgi:hypothetical protein